MAKELRFRVVEKREHENGQETLQIVQHERGEGEPNIGGFNVQYQDGGAPWEPGQVLVLKAK